MTKAHRDVAASHGRAGEETVPDPVAGGELLIFRAGPERFAFAVAGLEAVIDMPRLQPLPGMPAGMLGVAELRGTLVPVYSPESVLNVPLGDATAALVVRIGGEGARGAGRRIAIAVTGAEGVTVYEPTAWSGVGGVAATVGLVRGVATHEGQLTTLLDGPTFVAGCMDGIARAAE